MTLESRLSSDSVADHVADHNTLHDLHNLYEAITVDADDTATTL